MTEATLKSTNEIVEIVTVKGGWTTVIDSDGNTRKVRNSQIVQAEVAEEPAEKVEYTLAEAQAEAGESEEAEDEEPAGRRIVKSKVDLSRYTHHEAKTASGRKVMDVNDRAAAMLRGKTLDEAYEIVSMEIAIAFDRHLTEARQELVARYEHLNPGMQRMNLGNRLRKALKEQAGE